MKSVPQMQRLPPAALGRRLRAFRERRRLTLEQLAEYAGLSKGFVSRVERGLTSPSVASLVAICQVLRVNPGEVLDTPEPTVVRLAEAPYISLGGEGITDQLLSPPGQHELQLVRAVVEPGGVGESEMYTMDCELEALHVVQGLFVLKTQHGEYRLSAGDTVTFPGSEPHTWENPGDERAVVHWTLVGRRSASTLPLDTTRRESEAET